MCKQSSVFTINVSLSAPSHSLIVQLLAFISVCEISPATSLVNKLHVLLTLCKLPMASIAISLRDLYHLFKLGLCVLRIVYNSSLFNELH